MDNSSARYIHYKYTYQYNAMEFDYMSCGLFQLKLYPSLIKEAELILFGSKYVFAP